TADPGRWRLRTRRRGHPISAPRRNQPDRVQDLLEDRHVIMFPNSGSGGVDDIHPLRISPYVGLELADRMSVRYMSAVVHRCDVRETGQDEIVCSDQLEPLDTAGQPLDGAATKITEPFIARFLRSAPADTES